MSTLHPTCYLSFKPGGTLTMVRQRPRKMPCPRVIRCRTEGDKTIDKTDLVESPSPGSWVERIACMQIVSSPFSSGPPPSRRLLTASFALYALQE